MYGIFSDFLGKMESATRTSRKARVRSFIVVTENSDSLVLRGVLGLTALFFGIETERSPALVIIKFVLNEETSKSRTTDSSPFQYENQLS
jgi:hypothetical protein